MVMMKKWNECEGIIKNDAELLQILRGFDETWTMAKIRKARRQTILEKKHRLSKNEKEIK